LQGDPQWHVGVDPASAEAQVRGMCVSLLAPVTVWGMNLQLRAKWSLSSFIEVLKASGGLYAV